MTAPRLRTICSAVALYSLCCVGITEAVTIKMKSGRIIEGEVLERTTESIKIHNNNTNATYNIPLKQIETDIFTDDVIGAGPAEDTSPVMADPDGNGGTYFTSCNIDFKKLPAPIGYKRARIAPQEVKFVNEKVKMAVVVKFEPLPLKDQNCQMACFAKKVQEEKFFELFVRDFEKRQRINARGYELKDIDGVFGAEVNMVVRGIPTKFFVSYLGDQYVTLAVSGNNRSFDELANVDFLYKEVIRKLKTLCK